MAKATEDSAHLLYAELEHIYEAAPVGLGLVDRDLRIVRLNKLLAEFNGKPIEDQIGRKLSEVLPHVIERIEPIYRKVISTGESVLNVEFSRPHPKIANSVQYYLVSYHALKDENGSVLGVGTVVQDITDRRQVEHELSQRGQLLREAEQAAKLGSWRLDVATGQVEWSDELIRIFDVPEGVAPSFDFFVERLHPDDREPMRRSFEEQLGSDATRDEIEYRVVTREGEVRHILAVATFVRNEAGEATEVYGTAQDISQWKENERALRHSEENLSSILSTATDVVMSLDLEGTILYINHVVPGLSRDDVIGSNGFNYLQPEGRDVFRKAMDEVVRTGKPYQYETEAAGPHGTIACYSCRIGPVLRDSEVVGYTMVASDITKRKEAAAALKEREKLFRTIFEQAAVGVALIDTKTGEFVRINERYAELIGYSTEEMQTKSFMDVTYPDDLAEDLENMKRLHAGEIREFNMEKRLIHRDGTVKWFNLTVSPTWEKGEEPKHHIAIVKDISARKEVEAAIVASERQYRQLIETTQEGVWVIDAEGTTTFANERLAEMLGYSSDEMIGEHIFNYMDDAAKEEAKCQLERRRQGIKEQHDFRLRRKDGQDLWACLSTNPLSDEHGQHVGALAMVTDITARKRMERELQESHDELESRVRARTAELIAANQRMHDEIATRERIDEERERLSSIIEATPGFVGSANMDGYVRYLNKSARIACGVPLDECLDDVHIRDFHPEHAANELIDVAIPATIRDGFWQGELAWRTRDGREIPTAMVLQAHYSADGEAEMVSTIAHDISDLRDAEQALQRANRLASIGTLAAGISHEINNPLGAMLLTTEYALGKLDDPAIVEDSLNSILTHVDRCARIVRSVLQFSRDGYSRKSEHDLGELLRRVQDLTRQQAKQFNVLVEVDSPTGPCIANVNPLEIEQVFMNLFSNAIQASPADTKVCVKIARLGDRFKVDIRDQGKGMPPEILERVFDPFFTTRLHSGGTGLGLSIVHGIVRDHLGSIDVSSEPGQGTQVTVVLPISLNEP